MLNNAHYKGYQSSQVCVCMLAFSFWWGMQQRNIGQTFENLIYLTYSFSDIFQSHKYEYENELNIIWFAEKKLIM